MDKINLSFDEITKYGKKKFNFNMTNHLKDKTSKGIENACKEIADWILNNSEANKWIELPLWYISNNFRIIPVYPTDPIWFLLDDESKKSAVNWLIFKNHPRKSMKIEVTHFGPFGSKKNEDFDKKFNEIKYIFNEIVNKHLSLLKNTQLSEKQMEEEIKNFQELIICNYMKARSNLSSQIKHFKDKMIDIIGIIFGKAEASLVLTEKLEALTASNIKNGSISKEIVTLVTKQVAKNITLISVKISGKKTGKFSLKKVPFIGLGLGVVIGVYKAYKTDYSGALLEITSGAASMFPGTGTAVSVAIDVLLVGKDVKEAYEQLNKHQLNFELASKEIYILLDEIETLDKGQKLIEEVFFHVDKNQVNMEEKSIEAFLHLANVLVESR